MSRPVRGAWIETEQKSAVGKKSLRRRQWETSKKSVVMQIWLGKQMLGQRDNKDIDIKSSDESMTPNMLVLPTDEDLIEALKKYK